MCLSEGVTKTESMNSEEVLVTVIHFQDKKPGFVDQLKLSDEHLKIQFESNES